MHLHFVTTEEGAKPICKDMEMLKFGKITMVVTALFITCRYSK